MIEAEWSLNIAAITLCQEARGEPIDGQNAVAHAILNRQKDRRWGDTLASVCLWPHQFSGWADHKDPNFAYACGLSDDDATLSHMRSVLQVAIDGGNDLTFGATHYHSDKIEAPEWTNGAIFCGKFGTQLFYRGVK